MHLDQHALAARVARARSALGHGIRYGMGQGGNHPEDPLPTRNGLCDCSGFAAWVLGVDRHQADKGKPWSKSMPWIETMAIVRSVYDPLRSVSDQHGMFIRLLDPVPGCLAVYGDYKSLGRTHQGHVMVVEAVPPGRILTIDCSVSGGGIAAMDRTGIIKARGAIFVALRQDVVG